MISSLLVAALGKGQAEEALAKVREAYASVHSAVLFETFEITAPSGYVARGEARYEFLAPSRLRAAFKGLPRGSVLLICDGHRIAMYGSKSGRQELRYSPETLGRNIPTNVETLAFFDAAHELSKEKGGGMAGSKLDLLKDQEWNGKRWSVLRETNQNDGVSVDYYIDPKTFLIWRAWGQDTKSKKTYLDCQVLQLEVNPKISTERFRIPIPPDRRPQPRKP